MGGGVVDVGAFRTYPRGTNARDNSAMNTPTNSISNLNKKESKNTSFHKHDQKIDNNPENDIENDEDLAAFLPENKVKDFGVHRDEYYPLKVSFFKNKLDGAILEALSKKIGQSELFSYTKIIENAILSRNQVVNQIIQTKKVQKNIENNVTVSKPRSSDIDTQNFGTQNFGTQSYGFSTQKYGSLSSIAMASGGDKKAKLEMEISRLDNGCSELDKIKKTAGLIATDLLASYLPLKIKNEIAVKKGDMMQDLEGEDKNDVIEAVMKNYSLIDPTSSKIT